MAKYSDLADLLRSRIERGLYREGQRLPSLRILSTEHGVSLGTVQQAYRVLEEEGLASPLPKSGHFVNKKQNLYLLPTMHEIEKHPIDILEWDEIYKVTASTPDEDVLQLGRGMPSVETSTLQHLMRSLSYEAKRWQKDGLNYENIKGNFDLRTQISRLIIDSGCQVDPDEIIITAGCQEALMCSVRSICNQDDIVVVESPCFHGAIQILKGCGVKVIEVPTDPLTGIDLESLELIAEKWTIRAVLVNPNCNNPLGYVMPDDRKEILVNLSKKFGFYIVEDDTYGDLIFRYPRPKAIKSQDTEGRIILCGSFSKTLAPGLRVGWIVPGRIYEKVLHTKYISSGATATANQRAIAEFMEKGYYQIHLRRMRAHYKSNRDIMMLWISKYLNARVRVSRPEGGYFLWIELPKGVSAYELSDKLIQNKIQIATGKIFSSSGKYENCIRINYGGILDNRVETAVKMIGKLVLDLNISELVRSGVG
ncbi:DNA-binding transcriptional MocR family regulator [Pseudomonas sp. GGS8]|uniref:aminotransferase-like domain-containing protein n=1 Tax=Pseudomonas sp. GGS8 TaxID=2817892 RepID=UPI00209D9CFD|nr:DNA-binding transcriptional MocR family regulator [Pseudomonas sp. GGS8]